MSDVAEAEAVLVGLSVKAYQRDDYSGSIWFTDGCTFGEWWHLERTPFCAEAKWRRGRRFGDWIDPLFRYMHPIPLPDWYVHRDS